MRNEQHQHGNHDCKQSPGRQCLASTSQTLCSLLVLYLSCEGYHVILFYVTILFRNYVHTACSGTMVMSILEECNFSVAAVSSGYIVFLVLNENSFISAISIAPLQALYYSEALPTTARTLYRSFTRSAQATVGKGFVQGPYATATAGVELTTLQLK